MSKQTLSVREKAEIDYRNLIRQWDEIKKAFDFQKQTIHNIHLKKTVFEMLMIIDRLQMVCYLLGKYDD